MAPAIDWTTYDQLKAQDLAHREIARRLHAQLQGRGIRCWLDEHQLLSCDDLNDQIDRSIRFWDKVLLCCSRRL
jgi:TIR domain